MWIFVAQFRKDARFTLPYNIGIHTNHVIYTGSFSNQSGCIKRSGYSKAGTSYITSFTSLDHFSKYPCPQCVVYGSGFSAASYCISGCYILHHNRVAFYFTAWKTNSGRVFHEIPYLDSCGANSGGNLSFVVGAEQTGALQHDI